MQDLSDCMVVGQYPCLEPCRGWLHLQGDRRCPLLFSHHWLLVVGKRTKVCSALFSGAFGNEKQLRIKVCLHVSGEAEVNLVWPLTQEDYSVLLQH